MNSNQLSQTKETKRFLPAIINNLQSDVEFMVKFTLQHNLPMGFYALNKCPLDGWIFGAQGAKMRPLENSN